ncbi:exonuclease domain-containing protein [Salinarimonas sp. NSM]|uniref:exonuclease domain-containing protein n=1 Tax=Salinarimonas sp. NSM TaxID=3458003 RepID=UPI004035CDDD
MNPARWSLRVRIFLFFALIALGAGAGIVGALVYVGRALEPASAAPLVLAGLVAVGVTIGLTAWVWLKFDEHVARPLVAIAADVRAAVHARAARQPPSLQQGRYLGVLAPAVAEFRQALDEARLEVDAAVSAATARADRQTRNLEIVLRDLRQGVVLCTLAHKVTLYNRRAQEILGACGEIGLDRPLTEVLSGRVLAHTLERLEDRFRTGRHQIHRDGLTTTLVGATARENARIVGRMSLMLDPDGARPTGYVLSFEDVTNALAAGVWRDRLLQDGIRDMRERVAALALAGELLARGTTPGAGPSAEDVAFARDLLQREPAELGDRLDRLEEAASDLVSGAWPMATTHSPTLFQLVRARRSEGRDLVFETRGEPAWLRCDSASITALVEHLLNRIAVHAGTEAFQLSAVAETGRVRLLASWAGEAPPPSTVEVWLSERLEDGAGAVTGHDVLARHRTDLWCVPDPAAPGRARLELPLAAAREEDLPIAKAPVPVPERPEFYDFGLLGSLAPTPLDDRPLRALTFVVLDTETTGLDPARDALCSVAGVRIVNNRLMTGELFDVLVDPGRPIPAASSRVHGITDAMVAGAEPASVVLARFRAFVDEAVLVAHNAAFDLAFLERGEGAPGISFAGPVLDTVLLGAHLFGTQESLTLDALAERFGVVIPPEARHTALGDARATAQVLLGLIPLLEADGVRTLRDALAVSDKQARLRRRMAAQG